MKEKVRQAKLISQASKIEKIKIKYSNERNYEIGVYAISHNFANLIVGKNLDFSQVLESDNSDMIGEM